MPDLLIVFGKRWKWILSITLIAAALALIFALLSPKKYLAVATALPANSVTADKARMFNPNIEALYSDFGSPDELDRLEGTATLDTIFIAAARQFNLPEHYSISETAKGFYKSAMKLKKNTTIGRSSYGELKVKTWDGDRDMAASLSNFLMKSIQELHQHLQSEANVLALEKIRSQDAVLQAEYLELADSLAGRRADSSGRGAGAKAALMKARMSAITEQLQQYERMIGQYQLAVSTNTPVLLIVEPARPPLSADKPRIVSTVLFTFFAALVFSLLLVLFVESRNHPA